MALSVPSVLTTLTSTTNNGTSWATPYFLPSPNSLLAVVVATLDGATTAPVYNFGVSGSTASFGAFTQQVISGPVSVSNRTVSCSIYTSIVGASPTSGTVSIWLSGTEAWSDRTAVVVLGITGQNTVDPIGSIGSKGVSGSATVEVTLSGSPASASTVIGAISVADDTSPNDIGVGTGFTELSEINTGGSTATTTCNVMYDANNADTTADWSNLPGVNSQAVAIEIIEQSTGSTYEDSFSLSSYKSVLDSINLTVDTSALFPLNKSVINTALADYQQTIQLITQKNIQQAVSGEYNANLLLGSVKTINSLSSLSLEEIVSFIKQQSINVSDQLSVFADVSLSRIEQASFVGLTTGTSSFTDGYGGDVWTAKDAQMSSVWPTFNGGGHANFQFALNQRCLIEFDASSIPSGSLCLSARLYLYHSYAPEGGGTVTINVYSIASGNAAWQAGTKDIELAGAGENCWNALAADGAGGVTTPWAGSEGLGTSGTDYEATPIGTFQFDGGSAIGTEYVCDLDIDRVRGWFGVSNTNYGLIMWPSGNSGHVAQSGNSTTAYRPKLVIVYSDAAGNIYEVSLSLSKSLSVLNVSQLLAEASLLLGRYGLLTTDSIVTKEVSLSVGRILSVESTPSLTIESNLLLNRAENISFDVNGIYSAAISLASALAFSDTVNVSYETSVSLLRQMAITAISEVGATTYEVALELAKQLSVSASVLGIYLASTDLGKGLVLQHNANLDITEQISLEKSIAISVLSGLLLESALQLGRIESVSDSASVIVEESIGLTTSKSMSDQNVADLLGQLSLGKTVALNNNVVATLNVDAEIGKNLIIEFVGGFDITEDVVLNIQQTIVTVSQAIALLGNIPARLVIGDKTVWILRSSDRLSYNSDVGDRMSYNSNVSDTDQI